MMLLRARPALKSGAVRLCFMTVVFSGGAFLSFLSGVADRSRTAKYTSYSPGGTPT